MYESLFNLETFKICSTQTQSEILKNEMHSKSPANEIHQRQILSKNQLGS